MVYISTVVVAAPCNTRFPPSLPGFDQQRQQCAHILLNFTVFLLQNVFRDIYYLILERKTVILGTKLSILQANLLLRKQ